MKRWLFLGLALAAAALLAFTACPAEEEEEVTPTPAPPPAVTEVHVVLNEWSIIPDVTSVPAGDVTFEAHNEGAIPHELHVYGIGADVDIAALPVAEAKADPEAVGAEDIGEIHEEDLPAGATAEVTLDLRPGRYLLICNIPGHYQQGMYAELTVEG